MKVRTVLGAIAIVFSASVSGAAGEHAPEHGHNRALHGGVAVEVRDMDFELVGSGDVLTIYVRDHNKPVNTAKASGKVTVLSGTQKVEAPLVPAGENKLSAKGGFNVTKGTKVVALVELPGKKPFNVRFAVK
jgi:hypothetical protein